MCALGTVHAFKGLEADVVIYLGPPTRHLEGPRLAYTAYPGPATGSSCWRRPSRNPCGTKRRSPLRRGSCQFLFGPRCAALEWSSERR